MKHLLLTTIPVSLASYIEGLKKHDVAKIASALADEVVFVTSVKTMRKTAILEFLSALYRGFPDWSYEHDEPIQREDGMYGIKWRQGGTHTGTLEFPGFEAVAATSKRVTIAPHHFFYRVGEAGLTEICPDPVPGGAPRGIFEQIGVELPPL
jgi:hypothetical protein